MHGRDGDGRLDPGGLLRAIRRRADLSQRELAQRSGVPLATLARIESGAVADPRLRTVERLVAATGARLTLLDLDGTEPAPWPPLGGGDHAASGGQPPEQRHEQRRDQADRRLPAHLDPIPASPWRGAWRAGEWRRDRWFYRNRRVRDEFRRDREGTRYSTLTEEIRRLGPGDVATLASIQAQAGEFALDDLPAPPEPTPVEAAVRYLRDPSLRHWIVEEAMPLRRSLEHRCRVLGQLIAHLHLRPAGPPALVVTGIGVRPESRAGLVGPLLAAALCEEAARLETTEIVALADHPAVADYLQTLGFSQQPRRPQLLRLGP